MEKKYNEKEALELAGKLAISSENVFNSNLYTISNNLKQLKNDLYYYNKYIFDWSINIYKKNSKEEKNII